MKQNLITFESLINEYENNGYKLNEVCEDLRNKEFELKNLKLDLEFDEKFQDKREGLKVKEIPKMINDEVKPLIEEVNKLKVQRDHLEHEHKVLRLRIELIKEVIEAEKQ